MEFDIFQKFKEQEHEWGPRIPPFELVALALTFSALRRYLFLARTCRDTFTVIDFIDDGYGGGPPPQPHVTNLTDVVAFSESGRRGGRRGRFFGEDPLN